MNIALKLNTCSVSIGTEMPLRAAYDDYGETYLLKRKALRNTPRAFSTYQSRYAEIYYLVIFPLSLSISLSKRSLPAKTSQNLFSGFMMILYTLS